MKTLTELARELRHDAADEAEASNYARHTLLSEAAARLEAIDKAWREFDGMTQGNYTAARRKIRAVIEGKD